MNIFSGGFLMKKSYAFFFGCLAMLAAAMLTVGLGSCEGPTGPQGLMGLTGAAGKDGTNGTNGTNGTDGVDGQDGENGTNGKDGENGQDGTNGKDGENGQDGTNGKDGENGQDGADGKDGENGQDGTNGKDGENGQDGAGGANSGNIVSTERGIKAAFAEGYPVVYLVGDATISEDYTALGTLVVTTQEELLSRSIGGLALSVAGLPSTGHLKVATGKTLTVTGSLAVKDGGTVELKGTGTTGALVVQQNVTITGSGSTIDLGSTAADAGFLKVTGNVAVEESGELVIPSPSSSTVNVAVGGTVTGVESAIEENIAAMPQEGGTITDLGSKDMYISGNATMSGSVNTTSGQRVIVAEDSTLTVASGATLTVVNGATLNVKGTIAFTGTGTGTGTVVIQNGGTVKYPGDMTAIATTDAVWNTGHDGVITLKADNTTELTSGTVTAGPGAGIMAGTIGVVKDEAVLQVDSGFSVDGTLSVAGTLDGTGSIDIASTGSVSLQRLTYRKPNITYTNGSNTITLYSIGKAQSKSDYAEIFSTEATTAANAYSLSYPLLAIEVACTGTEHIYYKDGRMGGSDTHKKDDMLWTLLDGADLGGVATALVGSAAYIEDGTARLDINVTADAIILTPHNN
jgi:hypothetical protein